MNCQKCGKRQATQHVTVVKDNQASELHFCSTCMSSGTLYLMDAGKPKGFTPEAIQPQAPQQPDIEEIEELPGGGKNPKKCPKCGFTLAMIQKTQRVGCANDYEIWKDIFEKELKVIHGASAHTGKVPKALPKGVKISKESLEKRLEQCHVRLKKFVEAEDYEQAAVIRDEIKKLEDELI
jgi:protein arginine kinase activator